MGKIESGYSIGRNDKGVVIRVNGHVAIRTVLNHLENVANQDPEILNARALRNLKKSIIDSSTRISAILDSGGVISTDGKTASALLNESQSFPNLPAKLVKVHPDFLAHLRVEWRRPQGSNATPFFYQEGRQGAKLLIQDEFDAMVNLVNETYLLHEDPYPRINSRSVVNQILLSSIKARAPKTFK